MPEAVTTILYVTYDGVLEPLGESQVVAYLERLADGMGRRGAGGAGRRVRAFGPEADRDLTGRELRADPSILD